MTSSDRRYKGKVGVSSNNGSLRLSLPRSLFEGKQRYLSLGLKDTPENREIAKLKAHRIELDIKLNNFDFSLKSYRSQSQAVVKPHKHLTLLSLFEQFMEVKRPTVRPGTFRNSYKVSLSHLRKSPFSLINPDTEPLGFAQKTCDWAVSKFSLGVAKRFIIQLNACLNWAISSRLIELKSSPFVGLASQINNGSRKKVIEPFTLKERNDIIGYYESHSQYNHYSLFVAFCFLVGCRPSEAIALEKSNVSFDWRQVNFTHAFTLGEQGRKRSKGLKTQEQRVVYISESARSVLKEAFNNSNTEIVFPGVRGSFLGYQTFLKSWKVVLQELNIKYRRPYQMRHTFITLCLEAGVSVKDIAKAVGNSPQIIYKHYAENQAHFIIPDL